MYHPVVKVRMFAVSNKIRPSQCNKVSRDFVSDARADCFSFFIY